MNDGIHIEISIPADDEGYILLKCPTCGTFFKAISSDITDECVLHIFCPGCGLINSNYITEDVVELSKTMVKNKMTDLLHQELKKINNQSKGRSIAFKVTSKSLEPENLIHSGIEALEIVFFPCCKRAAKIKPILKMTGCYCLFCGVKCYELE